MNYSRSGNPPTSGFNGGFFGSAVAGIDSGRIDTANFPSHARNFLHVSSTSKFPFTSTVTALSKVNFNLA